MNRGYMIANGILWATAILASAALGAPTIPLSCPASRTWCCIVSPGAATPQAEYPCMHSCSSRWWAPSSLQLQYRVSGHRFWVVVVALAVHGILDLAHDRVISNPGVPIWWPAFCLAYDLTAAAYLRGC